MNHRLLSRLLSKWRIQRVLGYNKAPDTKQSPQPWLPSRSHFNNLESKSLMKNTTRIGIVLGISIAFFLVEIAGTETCHSGVYHHPSAFDTVGFRTRSLALIADAVRSTSV